MRRSFITGFAVIVLVAGLWQTGRGIWIYTKAMLAQGLLQRAWLRTNEGHARVTPWPWADTWPVARLRAPAFDIDLIVLDGAYGRALAFGPGLTSESPGPETTGPIVISAHRDTHFRFLKQVRIGDELILQWPRKAAQRYGVAEARIVDARTATIARDENRQSLVLITCYPFDAIMPGGPLRYVVTADLLDAP
ncbi:MAG: class GN sortase [Nitrospiraceae bacterium]